MMKTPLAVSCRLTRSPSPMTLVVRASTMVRAKCVTVLVVVFALVTVAACERLAEPGPEASGPPDAGVDEQAVGETLGEDAHMVALAREIPGFGGYWREAPGGRLVVALTEAGAGNFPAARRAVLARRAADVTRAPSLTNERVEAPPEVVERVVEYSFIELARHRARLRSALFAIPEVVSLAVDEELNRIVVGLEDMSGEAAVVALAADLGVPVEMVSFSQKSRARMSMSSGESSPHLSLSSFSEGTRARLDRPRLDRPIADGRLRGGYQVQAEGGKICTLGFTAVLGNGGLVFVSNSHCSKIPWRTDFGDWGQPDTDNIVGVEVEDPPPRRCGIFRRKCRDSDASMMAVDTGVSIALGEIGRTERRDRDCGRGFYPGREPCTVRIDSLHPTITMTHTRFSSDKNDVLDKIGRTSGWTFGLVKETCEDIAGETGVKILCADVVRMVTADGDSGAPVFKYYSDGTAEFRGIVYAYRDFRASDDYGRETIFQDLEQIQRDLGALTVLDPGPPVVEIMGRDLVPPGKACTWIADARGLQPFSYEWSGVLGGSDRRITDIVRESGWLRVTVTDPLDRVARDSIDVTVGRSRTCEIGGGGGDTIQPPTTPPPSHLTTEMTLPRSVGAGDNGSPG